MNLTPCKCGSCNAVLGYSLSPSTSIVICESCLADARDWIGQNIDVCSRNPLALALGQQFDAFIGVWTQRLTQDPPAGKHCKQLRSLEDENPWECDGRWEILRLIRKRRVEQINSEKG